MKKATFVLYCFLFVFIFNCYPQLQYSIQNKGAASYKSKQGKAFKLTLITDSSYYKRIKVKLPKNISFIEGEKTEKINKDSNTYSIFVPNEFHDSIINIEVRQIHYSACSRTSATIWRSVFKYPIVLSLSTTCFFADCLFMIYTYTHDGTSNLYLTEQSFKLWATHRLFRDEMLIYDLSFKNESSGISIIIPPQNDEDTLNYILPDSVRAKIEPIKPMMVKVEGGSFYMGDSIGDTNQRPLHKVTLKTFNISENLVTVAEYSNYCMAMGIDIPNPPEWGFSDKYPIVNISYDDAEDYCKWLSDKLKTTYRLPTEAEWEYAARGGNKSQGFTFAGSNDLNEVGWYKDNSRAQANIVEYKKPNELGIFDMSGNVFEWCSDWYGNYDINNTDNPKGSASGIEKVIRGGCFDSDASECKVKVRFSNPPASSGDGLGFRIVSQD